MYCHECGFENRDAAVFCRECGARIGEQRITSAASPGPAGDDVAATAVSNVSVAKKAGLPKTAFIGVAATVVVACAGLGIYKAFFEPYPIDEGTFPDASFRSYVASTFDADGDGELSRDEASAVEYIGRWDEESQSYDEPVSDMGITNMEGIGCFKNLKGLVVNGNALAELDLRGNTALEYVVVDDGSLARLDVSGCSMLRDVWTPVGTEVVGLPGSMKVSHLIEDAELTTISSSTRELRYSYAPDGKLLESSERRDKSDFSKETYQYNEGGKPVSKRRVSPYGNSTDTYEYDDQGRLVHAMTADDDSGLRNEMLYAYDENGLATYKTMFGNSTLYTFDYEYASYKRLSNVKIKYDNSSGSDMEGTTSFKYDKAGNMTSFTVDVKDNLPMSYGIDFTYDKLGNMTSLTQRNGEGKATNKERFETLEGGLEVKTYFNNKDKPTGMTKYDKAHRTLSKVDYDDYGDAVERAKFAYTSEGLLTSAKEMASVETSCSITPIAHYGDAVTAKTVQLVDALHKPYELGVGSYLPDAERFINSYGAALLDVPYPYPTNLKFYLYSY